MVSLDKFQVSIPEGQALGGGYVVLRHGDTYTIRLRNLDWLRECDAQVSVDGKSVGTFRLRRGGEMLLERPANDTGRFTFYKADTTESQMSGQSSVGVADRGLITVTFKPEKLKTPSAPVVTTRGVDSGFGHYSSSNKSTTDFDGGLESICHSGEGLCRAAQPKAVSSGMTGLSGHSNQNFYEVGELDYDTSMTAILSVRLVHQDSSKEPRELQDVRNGPRATKVPAPV